MEQRIRKILSAKGLKMSDLANRVGMGQSNLVKSIKSNPKLSTLEDICVALGIEMTELLGGKEEKSDGVIVLNGETYTLYKPKTRTAQIKVYNDYQELRSNIRDFVKRSLKTKELGSIGGMVEDFEYFTLLYDYNAEDTSVFEHFYITIQYGKGKTWTYSYDTSEYMDSNEGTDTKTLIEYIINDIEGKVLSELGLEYNYISNNDE